MFDRRLTDLSVSEFLQAVTLAAQPGPAGGSVAALSGAASAALLVLVCDVFEGHRPDVLTQSRQKAAELQQKLLGLVDDDAAAFRGFLDTERGSAEREAGGSRVAQIPLDIGRACLEAAQLVRNIEPHVAGSMRLDVATANNWHRRRRAAPLTSRRTISAWLSIQFNGARLHPLFRVCGHVAREPRPRGPRAARSQVAGRNRRRRSVPELGTGSTREQTCGHCLSLAASDHCPVAGLAEGPQTGASDTARTG
jgi:hypothetical protein